MVTTSCFSTPLTVKHVAGPLGKCLLSNAYIAAQFDLVQAEDSWGNKKMHDQAVQH